jgi:hypothetical protein
MADEYAAHFNPTMSVLWPVIYQHVTRLSMGALIGTSARDNRYAREMFVRPC